MTSDRVQRRIEALLVEADQAILSEDWSTVAGTRPPQPCTPERIRTMLAQDPDLSSEAAEALSDTIDRLYGALHSASAGTASPGAG